MQVLFCCVFATSLALHRNHGLRPYTKRYTIRPPRLAAVGSTRSPEMTARRRHPTEVQIAFVDLYKSLFTTIRQRQISLVTPLFIALIANDEYAGLFSCSSQR